MIHENEEQNQGRYSKENNNKPETKGCYFKQKIRNKEQKISSGTSHLNF